MKQNNFLFSYQPNHQLIAIAVTIRASTSMISMHARPTWITCSTRMRRFARSWLSINDRSRSRNKRDRSKLHVLNSLNSLGTYITWYRPRQSQVSTIHPSSTLSLKLSMLKLNNTLRVPSRWTTNGSRLTRRRLSSSGRSRSSNKRPWNNRKYSMEKLSRSERRINSVIVVEVELEWRGLLM